MANDFILQIESAADDVLIDACIRELDDAIALAKNNQFNGELNFGLDKYPSLDRDDVQLQPQFINEGLRSALEELAVSAGNRYRRRYMAMLGADGLTGFESQGVKLQKTPVEGGYHRWHCEAGYDPGDHSAIWRRALAWMLYLNDVDDGGETEFVYQHLRVKPKRGLLVVWPAGWTHTHRGNPPYSNDKYIATGWVGYPDKTERANG